MMAWPSFDTVLVLDSISLADTGTAVTFCIAASPVDPVLGPILLVPWARVDVANERRERLLAGLRSMQQTIEDDDVPVLARPASLARDTRELDIQVVEDGAFLVSVPERTAVLTRAMLDAWLQQPDETAATAAQLTVLHEITIARTWVDDVRRSRTSRRRA